ncbi:MAG: alpha/beta hydrolase [Candidatus Limnocylindria bacterium]
MSSQEGKFAGYVDADGLRTYYEVVGQGEPLLLLHGGLTTIETLAGLTATLTDTYRVYLPERRGHGRTADVEGNITYESMAQDTIAFMSTVGLESAHVVGWSDGAVVGLLVALRRPDLARKLVLVGQQVNMAGISPEFLGMMELEKMPDILPPSLREMYVAVSPDGPDHWDVVVDKVWQMLRTEPNIALSELAGVSAPTLIVIGEHDFPTAEHAADMQRSFPNAQLTVVPDATHGLPMEDPELLGRLIRDFLG